MRRAPFLILPLALALVLTLPVTRTVAEVLRSESGFFIDLPEGFTYSGGDGKSRYSFLSPDNGMEVDLLSYDASRYASAEALATDALKRLGSTGDQEPFTYQGRLCVFAQLGFKLGDATKSGYAIFVGLRGQSSKPDPSAAAASPEKLVALLAYTDKDKLKDYAAFILSALDSFSADRAALRAPGPVSQYILPFPAEHDGHENPPLRYDGV